MISDIVLSLLVIIVVLSITIREITIWYRDTTRVSEFIEDIVILAIESYQLTLGSELASRKGNEARLWYLRRRNATKSN